MRRQDEYCSHSWSFKVISYTSLRKILCSYSPAQNDLKTAFFTFLNEQFGFLYPLNPNLFKKLT